MTHSILSLRPFRELFLPINHPAAFLKRAQPGSGPVVVCAGDSLTQGQVSADYVNLLRGRAGSAVEFVNAGLNADLSHNLRQRLDEIITCRPAAITLLIGTNDVNATVSPDNEAYYRRHKGLAEAPSLAHFQGHLAAIGERLRRESGAKLAFLSLPPLGEDLDSPVNRRLLIYNAVIRETAGSCGAAYLPLHEELAAIIQTEPRPIKVPPPYTGKRTRVAWAALQHYLFGRSWNDIATRHGFAILTDYIHLNDRGGAVVARLVGDWLQHEGILA